MVKSAKFILQASNAFKLLLLYSQLHSLVSMVTSAVLACPNPLLNKAEWCWYCIYLRNVKLNHFKMDEAMGLKTASSPSPTLASFPYKI
jgi:hypothetical protein